MKIFKIIQRILTKGFSFSTDPQDFKLEVVNTWYRGGFVNFKYTANGGLSWKLVHEAHPPLFKHAMDYNWTWEPVSVHLTKTKELGEKKLMFNSYQKILDFEKEQNERLQKGLIERNAEIKAYNDKMKQNFKDLNS